MRRYKLRVGGRRANDPAHRNSYSSSGVDPIAPGGSGGEGEIELTTWSLWKVCYGAVSQTLLHLVLCAETIGGRWGNNTRCRGEGRKVDFNSRLTQTIGIEGAVTANGTLDTESTTISCGI